MAFKVAIVGGEGTEDYAFYEQKCIKMLREKGKEGCGIMIYTNGDEFNDKFAEKFSIDIRYFYTDWKQYGNDALRERNKEMLADADAVIVFEDGLKDTKFFSEMAKEKGIPYRYFKKKVVDVTK